MSRCRYLVIAGVCFLMAGLGEARGALTLTNGEYNYRIFRSPSGLPEDSLRYIVRPPTGFTPDERAAIIISMHGVGPPEGTPSYQFPGEGYGDVTDYDTKYRSVIMEPFCPLDQTCWDNTGWAAGNHVMTTEPTHGIRMTMELIEYLQEELNLDKSRVYLIGASNGGYALWDLILRKPEMFAAAVPICGAGDSSRADMILTMPIRVYHASADYSNPVTGSQAMAKALRVRGGNPYYYEVPPGLFWGDTHADAWAWSWNDTILLPWLYSQSRLPDSTAPSVPAGLSAQAQAGGDRVSLTWEASTDAESPTVSYFVYRDGLRIARTASLSFTDSTCDAATSYQYQVSATNVCDKESDKCGAVSVQTLADTRAPRVLYVRTEGSQTLKIRFSEPVTAATAETTANYGIAGVTVQAAQLSPDGRSAWLDLSGLVRGQSYVLTVNNIQDQASNTIGSGSTSAFACRTTGFVLEEVWHDISGGTVSDLTNAAGFQSAPAKHDTLRQLQHETQGRSNFGARVRGYFFPGESGEYRLWVCSDDASQLFVGSGEDTTNLTLAARVESWFPAQEFDYTSVQFSDPLSFQKDTKYYFELLYKQGSGGENCAVAWKRLGGGAREVVPADFILPYPDTSTPTQGIGEKKRRGAVAPSLRLRTSPELRMSIDTEDGYHVEVFDSRGAMVESIRGSGPATFSVLPSNAARTGVYLVRAVTGDRVLTQSFLVAPRVTSPAQR